MASDAALLEAWRAGDRTAGETLLARHFERLYLFFANKVETDLDDLIQRTMLACVRARDDIRDGAAFRAYLFSIARRELIAFFRARAKGGLVDTSVTAARDLGPSPSAILVNRAEQRHLLEALRMLPLDLQIALELHYWEDLAITDLARVFDVPVGTAKSRLRRAREQLAAALATLAESSDSLPTTGADLDAWARSIRAELRARKRQ